MTCRIAGVGWLPDPLDRRDFDLPRPRTNAAQGASVVSGTPSQPQEAEA